MKLDIHGLDFLSKEEGGYYVEPYLDQRGIPTIAVGNTYYEDGTKVTMEDCPITMERAQELFQHILKTFEQQVTNLIKTDVTQNQFNALVSISYNIGIAGFSGSTLLKIVNRNPNDPKITDAFKMWKKAGTHENELLDRRIREAKLYFTK